MAADVTELLVAWSNGDESALDALTPLVAGELRRLASAYMAHERAGHLLQPTALINEAYLRLIDWHKQVHWNNRAHFFGVAAQMMRRVLVDAARERGAAKRGAGAVLVTMTEADASPVEAPADVVALDDALTTLAAIDPRQSRVVELRFFGGLSHEESARVLGVSVATVRRDWTVARAWLYRELHPHNPR